MSTTGWRYGGLLAAVTTAAAPAMAQARNAMIVVDDTRPIAVIDPSDVWGAALDGHEIGDIRTIYTPTNVAAMRAAGFGPITYRLRTELGIETWHWNPAGHWSDPARQQGYWISDAEAAAPITVSFGYRLPRRGRTIDDANNDSYSRIDDGDTTSFWKTDPYLDHRFTGDADSLHPQWFSVDLGAPADVGEIRLLWGAPYPVRYDIDYWQGDSIGLIDDNLPGKWRRFPNGTVRGGQGGLADIEVAPVPVRTRFVRVVMYRSSYTAAGGNGDPRDSLGFALREIYIGHRDRAGVFRDQVRHDTSATQQSVVLVSSTDPWHRAIDRDTTTAQPGFDLVMQTGLTDQRPLLVPTGLLFDTPENAAAEVRFLADRHIPLAGIELGEEPDGERVTPEDYGALYAEFARAIHAAVPGARLGGPSWQNLLDDPLTLWPDRAVRGAHDSWIGRFLDYLDAHHRRPDYQFFTFEWYPFDNVCDDPAANLAAAPGMLAAGLDSLPAAGLPRSIPRIMTEYGYSAHISPVEAQIPSALFDADLVGNFFVHGGTQSFFYGYEPGTLDQAQDCRGWGNLVMLLADDRGQARDRLPRFNAAWLLTHAWADSSGGPHAIYRAQAGDAAAPDSLLSVYAMRRPDHRWSLLLINRDPSAARRLDIRLGSATSRRPLRGPIDVWLYSSAQYRWNKPGPTGRPSVDLPPEHRVVSGADGLVLGPYSIAVITGW